MQRSLSGRQPSNVEKETQRVQESPLFQTLLGMIAAAQKWADRAPGPELLQNLTGSLRYFQEIVTPQLREIAVEVVLPQLRELAVEFDKWNISANTLSQAGWLPHYTTPFQDVAKSRDDIEEVRKVLLDYYQDNWQSVRFQIEEQLSHCDVDDVAKEAMREALESHEAGHYRSVCTLLFSEIERVIRVGIPTVSDRQVDKEKLVKGLVNENGPLETFMPWGLCDLSILGYVTKGIVEQDASSSDDFIYGLYESVTGPSDLQRLQHSEIPNRHAVLHGLVVYSSRQSSLNAIFLADYILRVVGGSKT